MSLKNVKAAVVTLGCKVNQYESDAMFDMLTNAEGLNRQSQRRCGYLYRQHMFCDEYSGAEVQTDAAPGKEAESGYRGGSRWMLCPGGKRRIEKRSADRSDHWEQ